MTVALSDVWGKDPLWDRMAGMLNRIVVDMQTDDYDRGPYSGTLQFYDQNYGPFLRTELSASLTQNGYAASATKLNETLELLGRYKDVRWQDSAPAAQDYSKVVSGLKSVYEDCDPLKDRQLTFTDYWEVLGRRKFTASRGEPMPEIVGYHIGT